MLWTIIIILLVLSLVGVLPGVFPHAANWGYAPGGVLGVILVIVVVLYLMGRL